MTVNRKIETSKKQTNRHSGTENNNNWKLKAKNYQSIFLKAKARICKHEMLTLRLSILKNRKEKNNEKK